MKMKYNDIFKTPPTPCLEEVRFFVFQWVLAVLVQSSPKWILRSGSPMGSAMGKTLHLSVTFGGACYAPFQTLSGTVST